MSNKDKLKLAAEKLRKTFNLDDTAVERLSEKFRGAKPSLASILEKAKHPQVTDRSVSQWGTDTYKRDGVRPGQTDNSMITKRPVSQWGTDTRDFGGIRPKVGTGTAAVNRIKEAWDDQIGGTLPADLSFGEIGERLDDVGDDTLYEARNKGHKIDFSVSDLTLDESHIPEAYKNHNPHLIAGLKPDTDEGPGGGTLTPDVRYGHHVSDPDLKVVVKPPVPTDGLEFKNDKKHSHYKDPNFNTSHREIAYHVLADKFFGLGDFVPETTGFIHPKNGELHSAQRFIPNTRPWSTVSGKRDWINNNIDWGDLQKIGIMNTLLGNNDRHGGNALVGHDNRLHLIDHGITFDYSNHWYNPDPEYMKHHMDEEIRPDVHQWIDTLKPADMKKHLAQANVPPTLAAVAINRLSELKKWSKNQRKRHLDGKQDHKGHFYRLMQNVKIHELNEEGGLYPAKEIAQQRKIYDR